MFVLIARWTVIPEHIETVLEALGRMTAAVEANEPGCVMYQSNRSIDDPNVIVLYERYVDEAAFEVHGQSEHFKSIVLGEIVPLLGARSRETFTAVHRTDG
ncbi:MAG: antibiotic biosynthesis monooxygenase family protein [Thermomicrobiales bacterium]